MNGDFIERFFKSFYDVRYLREGNRDMQIAFVSCSKKKKDYPCSAKNLYSASALFRKAFSFCKDCYDKVYIVSAKYGLLKPDEEIEPYDVTLHRLSSVQKKKWAKQVYRQLCDEMERHGWKWEEAEFVFHAGKEYRKFLIKLLPDTATVKVPLEGLGIGEQLRFYTEEGY